MNIETKKKELIDALNLMIEAGQKPKLPLNMFEWHCGTACCLCGDVAVYQSENPYNKSYLSEISANFANKLDRLCFGVFGNDSLVKSIYAATPIIRHSCAFKVLSEDDILLSHKHVTKNHYDRAIPHDYIRQVIKYIESYEG